MLHYKKVCAYGATAAHGVHEALHNYVHINYRKFDNVATTSKLGRRIHYPFRIPICCTVVEIQPNVIINFAAFNYSPLLLLLVYTVRKNASYLTYQGIRCELK